ncbi:hypothetical protein LXL04_035940 [Taraxacum kok-saghyz]
MPREKNTYLKKQPSKALQEDWHQIFGNEVASGIDCVAPSTYPNNDVPHFIIDDENPGAGGYVSIGGAETGDDHLFSS